MNLFQRAKNKPNKVKKNGSKRSQQKWLNQFAISQKIFESIAELDQTGSDELIKDACVAFRNPVVFDNQVSDAVSELEYSVQTTSDETVKDHLVGMSNIVLYIYKRKIYQRWNTVEDFVNTLRALQVLLPIPKSLNNKASFKSWQFSIDNIEQCVNWYQKLEREGITQLCDSGGNLVDVKQVWQEWYQNNKQYL